MSLRTFLFLVAALLPATAAVAQSDFPSKPIRIIVPFTPGGTADLLGRLAARRLVELYGKGAVVENKPGASGHVGAAEVARSVPDGHTLLIGTIGIHAAHKMYKKLAYNPAADLEVVTVLAEMSNLLVVHPAVPARTVDELIALAKSKPGTLNFGSAGPGSSTHMIGELFNLTTGVKMTHIPYKGSAPAMADVMGGQIQLMFENFPTALPQARAGRVRALAVTGSHREASLPDVPTAAETVPGYVATAWFSLAAPRGLPAGVAEKIQTGLRRALSSPEAIEELRAQGASAVLNSPAETARFIVAETDKWNRVIDAAKIQVE